MDKDFGEQIKSIRKKENLTQEQTEKVIKDSSETRRAKYNMISSVIGGVFILLGVILLVVKGMSVEYIDAQGILHENFFLLPLGFLCMFCGLISFVTVGIREILGKWKSVD